MTTPNRRDLYRSLSLGLGGLLSLALAVPGVAYLLDPLSPRRKRQQSADYHPLVRLSELKPGSPRAFPIIEERQDAWVKYPKEPIGSVWLIREDAGPKPKVVAYSAECPHLGCSINLAVDGKSFLCPCHTSAFDFQGKRINAIPPRGMDTLEVKLSGDADPVVSVRFQRFRTMDKEKIPLA